MKDHPGESEYKLPIRDSGEIIVSKAALCIRAVTIRRYSGDGRTIPVWFS